MSSEEQNNDKSVKGFAGLSSLLSDVDEAISSVKIGKSELLLDEKVAEQTSNQSANNTNTVQDQSPRSAADVPWNILWLFVTCIFVFLLWLILDIMRPIKSSFYNLPALERSSHSLNKNLESLTQSSIPVRPTEEKPPSKTNISLSTTQISYCLAEDIRIKGAEETLNNRFESDVSRFNVMVTDYNIRCGNFRYLNGALESAQASIEPYRAIIEAEGRSFFGSPTALESEQSLAVPVLPEPKHTVSDLQTDNIILDLQKRLNKLGYDVGGADDHPRSKIRTAIIEVQRVLGIPVNGIASAGLLKQLDSMIQKSNAPKIVETTQSNLEISPAELKERFSRISQPNEVVIVNDTGNLDGGIYPFSAKNLKSIELGQAILSLMPPIGMESVLWSYQQNSQNIFWIDNHYKSNQGQNDTYNSKNGLMRINVKGSKSTIFKNRDLELAWSIVLQKFGDPASGPEAIELKPGINDGDANCFGSKTTNCTFNPLASLVLAGIKAKEICNKEGVSGAKGYLLKAKDKRPIKLSLITSAGSGGASSWITLYIDSSDKKVDICSI